MTENEKSKINPLTIADKPPADDVEPDPIGFVVICSKDGIPALHEIPDHRTPNNRELFHINWFLTGSIVAGSLDDSEDSD